MHTKRGLSTGRQGEIATILTVTSMLVMAVGLFLGTTRKPKPINSKAAQDCLYSATAQVVKSTVDGPLLTLVENNNNALKVVNDQKQEGYFINTATGYLYNFTQNPFTFGPYSNPDKAYVDLEGLDETEWYIKKTFCTPIDGGLGCGTVEDPIQTLPMMRISNFHVRCGVNMKYGWVVERKQKQKITPILTLKPSVILVPRATNTPTPTYTPTPTPTHTPTPSATPTMPPTSFPTAKISMAPSIIPSVTPLPSTQQAVCNTAVTAGAYSENADIKTWEMGSKAGTAYLSYGMYEVPDKLEVTHDGITLYNTDGFVSGTQTNIPILYTPKNTTTVQTTLTSNRDNQRTIWWYALSCPKDPIPTTAICFASAPVKTISGSIKLDPFITDLCKNVDCVATIHLEQRNTGIRVREVRKPDFTYVFDSVKVLSDSKIKLVDFHIPNRPVNLRQASLPSNCFAPRTIHGEESSCEIDMTKEINCKATGVDFTVTGFSGAQSMNISTLQAIDVNNDKRINIVDLNLILQSFGSNKKGLASDVNKDGAVNAIDMSLVIGNLSKTVTIE